MSAVGGKGLEGDSWAVSVGGARGGYSKVGSAGRLGGAGAAVQRVGTTQTNV